MFPIGLKRVLSRDRQTDELLSEAGWLVLRFWEHEDPNEIADAIASAVEGRRSEL